MGTPAAPTLADVRTEMNRANTAYIRAEDKASARADVVTWKATYHAIRCIDEDPDLRFTQEQIDRICSIIATRVSG